MTAIPGARDALRGRSSRASSRARPAAPTPRPAPPARSVILAEAYDASGTRLADVRLEGVNGYDLTARFLAWGAETAAAGGLQGTGALGPVDGFGLDALQAGCAEAGLGRVL